MTLRLLRGTLSMQSLESLCRAPKKKKEAEAKIESTDIINIFKEREDPVIGDINQYPVFVHQYLVNKPKFMEQMTGIRWGSPGNVLQTTDWKRYLKGQQRMMIRHKSYLKHIAQKMDLSNDDTDLYAKYTLRDRFGGKDDEDEGPAVEEEEDDEDEDEDAPKAKKKEG